MQQTIVIIGGGAAGFFCAANLNVGAACKIIILEKSQKCLSKVKISGGGRCNVTHNSESIADMSKKYPRGEKLVKKTFHQFFVADTIKWFEKRGLKLKAEADNRMFPITDDSQSVIDVLWKAITKNNVEVRLGQHVQEVIPKGDTIHIAIKGHETIVAHKVVIASGGFPKIEMFDWLKHLDLKIETPIPSLFTFNIPRNPITQLMGLSVENGAVKVLGTKLSEQGPVLITHWGLSGPAILKTSAYGAIQLAQMNYDFMIQVNWNTNFNEETIIAFFEAYKQQHPTQKVSNTYGLAIPQRLWDYLLEMSMIAPDQKWMDLPNKNRNKLAKNITAFEFQVKGKTTFKEEFVTAGGIALSEIDANTMQSRKHANVYFAGEIINVDGVTGGFNFQNAWTTGYIAAQSIAESINV